MDNDGPAFLRYDFSRGAPGGIHEGDNNSGSHNLSEIRDVFSTAGSVIEKMDEQLRSRLQSRLSSRRSYNVLKQSIVEADYLDPPRTHGNDNDKRNRDKHINNSRDKKFNNESDDEDIIVSGGGSHRGNTKGMLLSSQAREVKYKVRPRKQKPTTRFFKRLVNMFKRNGSGNNDAV